MSILTKQAIKDDALDTQDKRDFEDKKPASKKPWIAMGVMILLLALLLQMGMSALRNKVHLTSQRANISEQDQEKESYATALTSSQAPLYDAEKEALRLELAKASDVLKKVIAQKREEKKSNKQVSKGGKAASKKGLLSTIKTKVTGDAQMERLLKASAVLSIGVSGETKKSNQSLQTEPSIKSILTDKFMPTQSDENDNEAFLKSVSAQDFPVENAVKIENLELKILEGKVIKGVMDVAINSELPGLIRAHVTEDVYAEQGDYVLIPNGSRLIGQYRSGRFKNGDVRVYVVWQRLIEPNGISLRLNASGSDGLGRSGMTGEVDTHFLERFGTSFLMSMLSAGASSSGVPDAEQYNSKAAYRMGMSNSFAKTAGEELQRNGHIAPTIMIDQGSKITIMVNKDLSFEAVARAVNR